MKYKSADIIFIINPFSGKRKPEKLVNKIKRIDNTFPIFISNSLNEFNIFIFTKITY